MGYDINDNDTDLSLFLNSKSFVNFQSYPTWSISLGFITGIWNLRQIKNHGSTNDAEIKLLSLNFLDIC